jgi:hypothetical protein
LKKHSFLLIFALIFLLLPVSLFGNNVAIFPIGADTRSEWTLAKDIDRHIDRNLTRIRNAWALSFRELLSTANRKALSGCRSDLKCQRDISTKIGRGDIDFFFFTRMRFVDGRSLMVQSYLFDRRYSRLETINLELDYRSFADEVADRLVEEWDRVLSKHATRSAPPPRDRYSDDFDKRDTRRRDDPPPRRDDSYGRSARRSTESIIAEGFNAYASGDIKKAKAAFGKAASADVVAKKLYNAVDEIEKYVSLANNSIKLKKYDEAIPIIARAESLDESIKDLGLKYRVYSQDTVERITYLEPTPKEMQAVEEIHKKYGEKTAKARKERVAAIAKVDQWINQRIREREEKIKQFDKDSKDAAEQEKKEFAELKNSIKELRYKWDQEDSELEQKIVAVESKLTLLEQRERGVVKVSTEKEEKARKMELAAVNKKFKELLANLKKEKDAFYQKQKVELEKGSKDVENKVVALQKQKMANEKKIVEIDKKTQAANIEFEKSERKFTGTTEEVRLKQEDEDRKFAVEAEKEYQKKFDELNKKLRDYDEKEAERREALKVYDKEIEEFLMKNVEIMSAFQEEVEKERTELDKKYKEKKEKAKNDAEKEYNEQLAKLNEEKSGIESKIAEEETPALKKQLAQVEKKIAAHESGKDEFIQEKVMQIDMELEMKSAELDMKLVGRNNELQKENEAFRKKKLDEKKKADADFQNFMKRKNDFKKSIDRQIELAQKERDRTLENRRKERDKLAGTWDKDREKRKAAFEKTIQTDINQKEKLVKANEKIDDDIVKINDKWAEKSQDIKVRHHGEAEKFEADWKERHSKTEEEFKASLEAVKDKYASKQLAAKEAQKQQKKEWEEEIQSMNEEKQRRKEERQGILDKKRMEWEEKQVERKQREEQRKIDKADFIEESKRLSTEDRTEAGRKKREIEQRFEDATKDIYQAEINEVQRRFPDEYRFTRTREVVGITTSDRIQNLKSDALAKSGLQKLQNRDILSAKRAFAEAIFIDRNNQIALDGMKSIELTAKSMYWEAFGMRESNKAKAREIFTLLVKTLMPSSEFFVKSKAALDQL